MVSYLSLEKVTIGTLFHGSHRIFEHLLKFLRERSFVRRLPFTFVVLFTSFMLSDLQKRVYEHKRAGLSYSEIIEREPEIDCNRQISCCLRRTALRLPWTVSATAGADPYLVEEDVALLTGFIEENAADFAALTTWEVMDCAQTIKAWRHDCAVREILSLSCPYLASCIPHSPNPPS